MHETVQPGGTAGPPFDRLRTDGQCPPLPPKAKEGGCREAARGVFHFT